MKIVEVRASKLDLPMKKAFGISRGVQELAQNVLVEVVLEDGTRGLGEGAPLPPFNGETQEATLAAIGSIDVVGHDARRWRALADRLAELPSASAACAIETAALDALARSTKTPLHAIFGGAGLELVTDITITTGTTAQASVEAREFAEFRTLKIKVGGRDVDHDVKRVLAVKAVRPDARILLDANAGFSLDEALAFIEALRQKGALPELFEQPIAGPLGALAEIRARTGVAIALDESITKADDVVAANWALACDAVNVKIMKSGISRALDIVGAARACGLRTMIGGMVETRLAMGTSASLAAGLGGFDIVDLDTPLFLAEDPFDGGIAYRGDIIDLAGSDRGHGCALGRSFRYGFRASEGTA